MAVPIAHNLSKEGSLTFTVMPQSQAEAVVIMNALLADARSQGQGAAAEELRNAFPLPIRQLLDSCPEPPSAWNLRTFVGDMDLSTARANAAALTTFAAGFVVGGRP